MSYEKQTWKNGDIITAEKLNHMEDGISESSIGGDSPIYLIVDMGDENGYTLYKATENDIHIITYGEIMNKLIIANFVGLGSAVFVCSQQQDDSCVFEGSGSTFVSTQAVIWSVFGTGTASDNVSNLSVESANWTVTPRTT